MTRRTRRGNDKKEVLDLRRRGAWGAVRTCGGRNGTKAELDANLPKPLRAAYDGLEIELWAM